MKLWVNQHSGFEFSIQDVGGFWRNTHPSIALQGVKASLPNAEDVTFSVERVEVEFDLNSIARSDASSCGRSGHESNVP